MEIGPRVPRVHDEQLVAGRVADGQGRAHPGQLGRLADLGEDRFINQPEEGLGLLVQLRHLAGIHLHRPLDLARAKVPAGRQGDQARDLAEAVAAHPIGHGEQVRVILGAIQELARQAGGEDVAASIALHGQIVVFIIGPDRARVGLRAHLDLRPAAGLDLVEPRERIRGLRIFARLRDVAIVGRIHGKCLAKRCPDEPIASSPPPKLRLPTSAPDSALSGRIQESRPTRRGTPKCANPCRPLFYPSVSHLQASSHGRGESQRHGRNERRPPVDLSIRVIVVKSASMTIRAEAARPQGRPRPGRSRSDPTRRPRGS